MARRVRLTDGITKSIIQNQELQKQFPFLESASRALAGIKGDPKEKCSVCRAKAVAKQISKVLSNVKGQIRLLNSAQRDIIKKAMKADTFIIEIKVHNEVMDYIC